MPKMLVACPAGNAYAYLPAPASDDKQKINSTTQHNSCGNIRTKSIVLEVNI